jgi:hypothetical protein
VKPTGELYDIAYQAYDKGERHSAGVENVVQAVLNHLFPEPGGNPLAVRAPDRDTVALRRLRNVLVQADHSELAIRGQSRTATYQVEDPEAAEILTAVSNVRRLLSPWGSRDWESLND